MDTQMNNADSSSRRVLGWLLLFLYFSFVYNYGAKISSLLYTDFGSFYYGARLVFDNHQSPYDEEALTNASKAAERAGPFEPPRKIYPYLYPPPSLVMFYPLAQLSPGHAKLAMLVVNHVCVLA